MAVDAGRRPASAAASENTMGTKDTPRYGPLFAISLLTSWTFVTGLIGMLAWSDRGSPERVATWIFIWLFTVGMPTLQAFRIHAVLSEMCHGGVDLSPRSRRALTQARVLILICGSMTVLLLFGLLA
jgi:hypothetical protein